MFRRLSTALWLILFLVATTGPIPGVSAQGEGLSLPAALFILTDQNQVMRIGAGGSLATAVTPPDQTVADFGIAPDGQWIVYRTTGSAEAAPLLAVTTIDGLSGQVLEFDEAGQPPIEGRGQTLAWSPDGTAIAYTTAAGLRIYMAGLGEYGGALFKNLAGGPFINLLWSPGSGFLAAEAENDVWWIYRREINAAGGDLVYHGQIPGSAGSDWVREGVLALAPPAGSLLTLDVVAGTQTALLGADSFVSNPAHNGTVGDERLIFFVHEPTGQRFAARRFGTVSTLGGDSQEFESAVELTADMRWMPDGLALTAVEDGTLTIIEPRTGSRREVITGVKNYSWGPLPLTEVSGMILPADLYFIARDAASIPQVWRLPANGAEVEQVTIEPQPVLDFALSPDANQIAYSTGGNLIVANGDGTGGRELSPIMERPGAGAQPAWSPDGQTIAYIRDGIWLVPTIGGARTELITDNLGQDTPPDQVRVYMNPRWSPDGGQLLVDIGYYEGRSPGILPITGGAVTPLGVLSSQAGWTPDNQILAWDAGFGYTQPGLYLVNPAIPDTFMTILDDTWHILDTQPLAPEAAAILRNPTGDSMGPGIAQPFLVPVLPDALPIPNGQGGLIEQPILSPKGNYAAGLQQATYNDYGLTGQLNIISLQNGAQVAIQTPDVVWALQWGPPVLTAP
ncbi:TolB family protein [Chloroflexota bacterium]